MKKITVSLLSAVLMLSMAFSSSVFAAEKTSAWDSFLGLFSAPTTAADTVGVEYRGHIQNVGNYPTDGTWVEGPNQLGTVGQSLRLEGFWIQLTDAPADLHIQYEVHVQNVGWMAPVEDGTFAGTEGMSWRIEAIKISLVDDNGEVSDDYTVMYKGHVQNYGDTKWYSNGEQLGTTGSNLRLEALEVKIVKNASDLTKYQAALEAVTESDYTATSWAAYMEVVEANEVTAANTQSEVDEATANIVAAQENLVPAGDVVSIAAINATTVEVTYASDLTSVSAGDYSFDPALTVSNAAVKQTNKKVAVLTIADATPGETYTLAGTDLSFTAISSVIPSAIALDTNSAQAVVGEEVTLAATVTVGEGESAAGIPVTFNVDAPVGSLNSDIIEEVFTDENGVATYTYTQYAAGTDAVAAYPTGKTTTRATANVFWGVADIMTVTESASGDAVNGTSRTYTVTVKNPANDVAVQNAVVNVMLAENIMANNTTAVVADPNTGAAAVSPFESATDETPFTITTNTNGVATFTLTGANTTATPIIFLDSNAAVLANAGIAGNNNDRLDASELQVMMPSVTFGGAQALYTFAFEDTTAAEYATGLANARAYTVTAYKADGSVYADGLICVGIEQFIDNNLTTSTTAVFTDGAGTSLGQATRQLTLDGDGQVTFYIAEPTLTNTNVSATPRVWIDLDASGNTNSNYEAGEPTLLGPTTTFQAELAQGTSTLDINTPTSGPYVTADTITATFSLLNQSGTVSNTAGFNRVTYTITNTSGAAVTINPVLNCAAGSMTTTFANGTTTAFANGDNVTINAGSSVTIAGTAIGYVAATDLSATNVSTLTFPAVGQVNTLTISATGTTVRMQAAGDARNVGSTSQAAQSFSIVPARFIPVTSAETITGTIIGYTTTDTISTPMVVTDNFGRIVLSLDGSGERVYVNYGTHFTANVADDIIALGADGTFAFPTTNFNVLPTTNTVDQNTSYDTFEDTLAIGNRVNSSGNTARTFYLADIVGGAGDASGNDLTAVVGNYVTDTTAPDVDGVTAVTGVAGTAEVLVNGLTIDFTNPVTSAPYISAELNGKTITVQVASNDTLTVTADANDNLLIELANTTAGNNTNASIETAIQSLGGNFANVTVTGTFDGGALAATITASPATWEDGVNQVDAVQGTHTFTLNRMLASGDTLTVTYNGTAYTYTAGIDFAVGTTVNTQAAAIAAALTLDGNNTAAAAGNVITITQTVGATTTPATTVTTDPVF